MAKLDFYCPACGETTKQHLEYFAPGQCDFTCENCQTIWSVKIEYQEKDTQTGVGAGGQNKSIGRWRPEGQT